MISTTYGLLTKYGEGGDLGQEIVFEMTQETSGVDLDMIWTQVDI